MANYVEGLERMESAPFSNSHRLRTWCQMFFDKRFQHVPYITLLHFDGPRDR
jgi:hypothetical protein